MFGNRFYNQGFRKLVVAFGSVFNNIIIQRTNTSGEVQSRIKVPLAYAPKEKFLVRLDEQANLNSREFAVTLPRMGFEITGISYDASRKLNRVNKFSQVSGDDKMNYNYTPVPYNITFGLYVFTATAEDGLQIIEQILPFFQPEYSVTLNIVPELNIKRDIPIVLGNVQYEDTYNGSFTERRAVIYTLSFTAKTYLYGPMNSKSVIKKTQSDIYSDTDVIDKSREERIVVVPNPTSADADDDFGFTTTISFFNDTKKYNPESGTDE